MAFQDDAFQNDTNFATPGFQVTAPAVGVAIRRKLTVIGVGYCLAWFFLLSEVF